MKKLPTFLFFIITANFCFAQTVNLKDFEKLPTVKSPREYLEKKDFVVKQDSSSGKDIVKLKMVNKATKEIVHLTSTKGSTEDTLLEVDYFTETQEEYAKIVHTILKSGYNMIGDERHYEKHTGNNQTHTLELKGAVSVKGWDYYSIYYSCYATKKPAVVASPKKSGVDFFK